MAEWLDKCKPKKNHPKTKTSGIDNTTKVIPTKVIPTKVIPTKVIPTKVKRTRKPSEYNLFIKQWITDHPSTGKPNERMILAAAAWAKSTNTKSKKKSTVSKKSPKVKTKKGKSPVKPKTKFLFF